MKYSGVGRKRHSQDRLFQTSDLARRTEGCYI